MLGRRAALLQTLRGVYAPALVPEYDYFARSALLIKDDSAVKPVTKNEALSCFDVPFRELNALLQGLVARSSVAALRALRWRDTRAVTADEPPAGDGPETGAHVEHQGSRPDLGASPGALLRNLGIDQATLVRLQQQIMQQAAARIDPYMESLREVVRIANARIEPALVQISEQVSSALKRIDLSGIARMQAAFNASFANLDWAALAEAMQRFRDLMPPNWEGVYDLKAVAHVALDDGIPVMWVPRAVVLADLVTKSDRAERIGLLLTRQDDVIADCRALLTEITHPKLLERLPVAAQCIDALAAGFSAPAQALAAACTESLLTEHIAKGRSYKKLAEDVQVEYGDIAFARVREIVALYPVARFYTPWWPSSGDPPPEALSRHVTAHLARADHLTRENGLIAIMLLASLLRHLNDALEL